jgi:hypothetical protein
MIVEFETSEGLITVDTDEEIGDITPPEFRLITEYAARSGFLPDDPSRARAGGALLVLLSRKLTMSPLDLLHKVLTDA